MAFSSNPTDSNGIPIGSVYVPGVGFKALQGGAVNMDTSSNESAPVRVELVPGSKATYGYARSTFAIAATPTDVAIINGSASKTVRITRIEIEAHCTAATAATLEIQLIKRSTANAGGTTTGSPTGVPYDSANAAATALMLCYTANPTTTGTSLGIIRDGKLTPVLSPYTATDFPSHDRLIFQFGDRPGTQEIVLRGTAEGLAINLAGAAIPAGLSMGISLETTEE